MTEEQPDAESPAGGPSWMRNAARASGPLAPAAVEAEPTFSAAVEHEPGAVPGGHALPADLVGTGSAPGVVNTGSIEDAPERLRPPTPDYSRHAVRPLPYAVVSLVSLVALVIAAAWASRGGRRAGEGDTLEHLNGIWYSLSNLLLPQARTFLPVGVVEAVVVLVVAAIAISATAAWVGRLGRNVAMGQASFGAGLALLGLPAWWTLPLTAGTFHQGPAIRLDELMRLGTALVALTLQLLVFRWSLVNKIWRAGRIPGDLAALLLWIPELIPWGMYLGSTMVATIDDRGAAQAAWRPTPAMADWGYATSLVTMIAIFVLLAVVTVRQQLGIAADRRRDAEAREAAKQSRAISGQPV